MPCSSFWPGPDCGFHGLCVANTVNGSNSFCQCEDGWGQSLEWNFEADEESLSSSVCAYNETLIITLYSLSLIFVILHSFGVLRNVRTLRQLRRRKTWILLNSIVLSLVIYRLSDPTALIMVDITVTVLMTSTGSLIFASSYLFLTKYLDYISSKVYDVQKGTRAIRARTVFYYMVILGVVLLMSLSILAFLLPRHPSSVLVRCVLGYFSFFYLYQTIFLYRSLSELISDMEIIVTTSARLSSPDTESTSVTVYFEEQIPKQKSMRRRLLTFGIILMMFFLLPAINPKWLLYMTYVLPSVLLIHYIYGFIYFLSKPKPSNNSKTTTKKVALDQGMSSSKLVPSTTALTNTQSPEMLL
mmetsp:Transcript_13014/g.16894  ORF Transcript_13014/g.16894 Transcript_13014/m.16894 type:complete len:357 (-) Transcript_13014:202-1272(-)